MHRPLFLHYQLSKATGQPEICKAQEHQTKQRGNGKAIIFGITMTMRAHAGILADRGLAVVAVSVETVSHVVFLCVGVRIMQGLGE